MPPALLYGEGAPQYAGRGATSQGGSLIVPIFFIATLLPISWTIGGMALDPTRLLLIVTFVPFFARLVTGKAGKVGVTDISVAAFAAWIVVTLTARHGVERLPYGVILAVEAFGGYLAGRTLIRSSDDYKRYIDIYVLVLAFMAPFAIYELLYSRMPLADLFRGIFSVPSKNLEERYNLSRVQVVFPHSILFGLFCSLTIASIFYIYKSRIERMLPRLGLAIGVTFMSLSSAPLISVVLQCGMAAWGVVTKDRWRLLASIFIFFYILTALFSNRGPVLIFVETFTFDPRTAWWRLHTWNFGSASVLKYPIFGIGLDVYEKPTWLTDSVDNFWLLMAMRHGLVGFLFLAVGFAFHIRAIVKARTVDPLSQSIQKGYTITLVGLIFTLATVHVWGTMNVMVMFFLGAGSFLYNAPQQQPLDPGATVEDVDTDGRKSLPLTRFSHPRMKGLPLRSSNVYARPQPEKN